MVISRPMPLGSQARMSDLHPNAALAPPRPSLSLEPGAIRAVKTSTSRSARPSLEREKGKAISVEPQKPRDPRRQHINFRRQQSDSPPLATQPAPPATYDADGGEGSTRVSHENNYEKLPSFIPLQSPKEKLLSPEEQEFERALRRRRIRVMAICAIILLLVIATIILLVRIVRPKLVGAIDGIGHNSTTTLNDDQSRCLNDFRDNAPSNPTAYQCSNCLPTLQSVSSDFLNSASNARDADLIAAAKQFCGASSIFTSANTGGQNAFSSAGWMKDVKICTWGGVTCDGSGSITALSLQHPAIPQVIPGALSALTSLVSLSITGDKNDPTGPLNGSLPSSLRDLQLYNTSFQGFESDAIFKQDGALAKLKSLTMDGNWAMGGSLPDSILNVPLQNLTVRNQNLYPNLLGIGSSTVFAETLELLDLSYNGFTQNLTSLSLPRLLTLDLSNNNLVFVSPGFAFPSLLRVVHMQNNPALHGGLSSALCQSTWLTDCNFQLTGFSSTPNITCGICRFN